MGVHLVKLSVGTESIRDLAAWQAAQLRMKEKAGQTPELIHITRQTPKRAEELLNGGSIYWVIKGVICARQRLLEFRPLLRDGIPHCGIVHDSELIRVRPQPRRAFQGWRYLTGNDAPPDITAPQEEGMEDMLKELAELGLL